MTETAPITRDEQVKIDTLLGELHGILNDAYSKQDAAKISLARALDIRPEYVTRTRREVRQSIPELLEMADAKLADESTAPWTTDSIRNAVEKLEAAQAKIDSTREAIHPLQAIYNDHRWSRFFLVTSSAGGHIHSSTACSTTRIFTTFGWLPELSGLTEADAVAEHGTILCSVCYPSAPVEWTRGNEKPVDPNRCPGSGTHDHDSSGLRYYSPRAVCSHCKTTQSVTSTGKLRQHKGVTA
jgi:hypothetical protein